jgi:trehalose 6-phosphate phosphatase
VPESSRRSDPSPSRALSLAREALAATPAGLLTDFDGTLSPIVGHPGDARLADGASEALATLAGRLDVVAIITGRAALDARSLIGVPQLLIVGNHGTEWLEPNATDPTGPAGAERARLVVEAVLARIPELPGVRIEDKGLSATVHVRNAPDPDEALAALRDAIGDPGDGVALRPGRMSLEVRPVGLGDKGQAARQVIDRRGLRGVLVMGDDVTDLDMFSAVAGLREAGSVRAAILAVGGDGREVPAEVADAADVVLPTPSDAARLLIDLARAQA